MSVLEQEIIEKFRQLDQESRQRILATLEHEIESPQATLKDCLKRATLVREKLRKKYGSSYFFDVQALLDEIREEASWPRWS